MGNLAFLQGFFFFVERAQIPFLESVNLEQLEEVSVTGDSGQKRIVSRIWTRITSVVSDGGRKRKHS